MATELLQAVVEDGVRITNFFNGRLLTAEDLRREQDAARDRHRGLAGAVGEGVVQGLEVELVKRDLPAPTVRITAGIGFNRDGDPVALPRDVELRLLPAQAEADQKQGLFALCDRPSVISEITNPGFYVLAARPAAAQSRDQVPTVDLSQEGLGSRCGARYTELGASFSLVPLPLPAGNAGAPLAQQLTQILSTVGGLVEKFRQNDRSVTLDLEKALSRLRNGMAYWVAGHDVSPGRVVSLAAPAPVGATLPDAPLEALRGAGALAGCDLPLALLYVTRRQLEWVDMWTVRRTPVPRVEPDPLSLAGELPPADAVAAFMQFREHAAAFLATTPPLAPAQVRAEDWFLFLPPAGVLPLQSGGMSGFAPAQFFPAQRVNGPESLAATRIPALLRGALEHPPVALASSERVWLYTVSGPQLPGAAPSLLFTSYPLEPDLEVSPVRITAVTPHGGRSSNGIPMVQVGEALEITGKNFEASQNATQVLIDGTPVTGTFIEATDSRLRFLVPPVPELPVAGRVTMLVVSNRSTSGFRPLKVIPRPGTPETGKIDVEFMGIVDPPKPLSGLPVTFRYLVRNRTAEQANVVITAVVSPQAWPAVVREAAAETKDVPGVVLNAGEERSVFVRTTIPPSVEARSSFTLTVNAQAGAVTGSSGSLTFEVDSPASIPDPHVHQLIVANTNPGSALQGNRINVSPYYPVTAVLNVTVDLAATYELTAEYVNGDGQVVALTNWSISLRYGGVVAGDKVEMVVTPKMLQDNGNNPVSLAPQVVLSVPYYNNPSNPINSGNLRIRVKRKDQARFREITITVQRIEYWWYYYF